MFLQNAPLDKITFLYMDFDFTENLRVFLEENNYKVDPSILSTPINEALGLDQDVKYRIKSVIKQLSTGLPYRLQHLEEWFHCDRQLIDQVQFYRKSNGSW